MKNLAQVSILELKDFFRSFNRLIIDVDGVLWMNNENIPGTAEAVRSLKRIEKEVLYVSNNTRRTLDDWAEHFKSAGFDFSIDDIVTPVHVMIWYLNNQIKNNLFSMDKKVFVIGMPPLKQALQQAGFILADNAPDGAVSSEDFFTLGTTDDVTIGAVIVDTDINLNYVNLQMAANYLKDPNVHFLAGAKDIKVPYGRHRAVLGPGNFVKVLEEVTGRESIGMAKPSDYVHDYILGKFPSYRQKKVLFVGDSISEDMFFAARFNFKKLLVLTGSATKEMLENWKFQDIMKPDFYVISFADLHHLIGRMSEEEE